MLTTGFDVTGFNCGNPLNGPPTSNTSTVTEFKTLVLGSGNGFTVTTNGQNTYVTLGELCKLETLYVAVACCCGTRTD